MLSRVYSAGLLGIDAYPVEVEVDISQGLAKWTTVGLPESTVRESQDRVIAAIRNSGYDFHRRRITINLAPADIKKEGTAFDLPIAIGLLASSELFDPKSFDRTLVLGELTLQGEIKPIRGALSIAVMAKRKRFSLFLPEENAAEALLVPNLPVFSFKRLDELIQHLTGEMVRPPASPQPRPSEPETEIRYFDFAEIRGQDHAKRAMEIAAAGGHNLLMLGPPGSGKTMLAQRLPTILPPMEFEEALETTRIYSVVGLLNGGGPLLRERPFRAPHHTISDAGLAGGGTYPRPGEVSLAHQGVLFLDELPEFKKNVLEILRQPLESGAMTIARALSTVTYPARLMLVASMNPCRCGYLGSTAHECTCTPQQIQHYRAKVSGPLLDRIDLQIEVPAVKFREMAAVQEGESSLRIRERVITARKIQQRRYAKFRIHNNSQMNGRLLRKFCPLDSACSRILEQAVEKLGFSARAYDRILKVTRTIADLAGSETTRPEYLAEAIQYRSLDRKFRG